MSQDYFAHAAFGILLTPAMIGEELHETVTDLLHELHMADRSDDDDIDDGNGKVDIEEYIENTEKHLQVALAHVRQKLLQAGIDVAEHGGLIYTGDEDDRPGCCQVEAYRAIYGFGLLNLAYMPPMSSGFHTLARVYTWVTAS